MTEQQTSFGGLAVADPRSPAVSLEDDAVDSANRRKLAIVGAVAAVLVVFVAAFFLLKGNGSSNNAATIPPHVVPPASSGTTAGTGAAAKPAAAVHLPKAYTGNVGRDPFKALYVQPQPKSGGAGGGTTTTTTVATTPGTTPVTVPASTTNGTTTGTTGSTPPATGTTTGTGLSADYVPVWVELVKVNGTSSATFTVGYTNGKRSRSVTYANVAAPTGVRTVFAKVFSLLSIQNGTATVQVGDGTPFDLTKGFSNRHFLG